MIAIGFVDAVERAAMSLADILGHLEIIVGVIACKPAPGKVLSIRQSSIQPDRHDHDDQEDFKPVKTFHDEISNVIFPKFSFLHNRSCAAAASCKGYVLSRIGLSFPLTTRSMTSVKSAMVLMVDPRMLRCLAKI
jgi:hypothetical protein